jgi:hypothetical protein
MRLGEIAHGPELLSDVTQALHTLQSVPETGSAALGALCTHLQRMNVREDRSHVTSKEREPSSNHPRAVPAKRLGASPVLSRPFLNISGRRRVPKLVNAQGVPFLRIAKPQPPFLSRIILDKHRTRQKRFNLIDAINETKRIAEAEDGWDRLLALEYGVKDERRRSPPPSWVQAYQDAIHEVYDKIQEATNANASMARKMWAIVEQEKELAEKEKAERRKAKLVLKLQTKHESSI